MTDLFGAFARGHEQGDALGDRMAARGLRRRVEQAESDFRAGKINADQYEQSLRDAQARGMARYRDTSQVAEGLRTRAHDDLNRRDDRHIAGAAADGRMVDAWQVMRNRVGRTGDVDGGMQVRKGLDSLDEAGQVTNVGGQNNYAPVAAQQEKNLLRLGDTAGAQAAGAASRTQMDDWAGRVFSDATQRYQSGDQGGALAAVNSVIDELGLPFDFQLDGANGEGEVPAIAMVPKGGEGQALIMGEREFFQQLGSIADGSNSLKNLLSELTKQDDASDARAADLTKRIEDGVIDILTESGANPAAAGRLSAAIQGAQSAGIQTIETAEDGTLLLSIGGQMVMAKPPVAGADGREGQRGWQFLDAESGNPVETDPRVAGAVQAFTLAERMAFDQGQYRINAEDRNMRIAQLMQFGHSQLGRPGVAPAAAGMLLDATTAQMDDTDAIEQFASTVDQLEGTGKNGASTAEGRGQFIDSTMLGIARKYFPEAVAEMDDAQILQLRQNPEFMGNMIRAYAQDNIEVLRRNDVPVNPVTLYMGHHFGGERAVELFGDMQANPQMSVAEAFTPRELRSNPYLADPERNPTGTLGGVLGDWQQRQSALFDGLTGRQAASLLGPQATASAPQPAAGAQRPGAAPAPTGTPQVAAAPEAQRLAALQQRQAQLEKFVRLSEAQAAPDRRTPAAGLGGVAVVPSALPGEGLSREDREALVQAREDLQLVKSEIQAAQLAARAAEQRARLESSLTAMRSAGAAAGLPPRNPNGAP